jgi:hypothetical protein
MTIRLLFKKPRKEDYGAFFMNSVNSGYQFPNFTE